MEPEYQTATNITLNHVIEKIEHLTFPPIRKKIKSMKLHEPFTGVWAIMNGQIIGAVLADVNAHGISELFSFYVIPVERNKGIGKHMLSLLEATLKDGGIKWIQTRYRSDWHSIMVINKLLRSNHWEEPILIRVISEIDINKYNIVPWPSFKLPSQYEFILWQDLNDKERNDLTELIQAGNIPPEFNPFQHEDKIFQPCSIGLKYRGQIAGWNIVYKLKANTIEYNNLYLAEKHRKFGYAIALLHRSFGIQFQLKIPKATWIINADNKPVMKMAHKIAEAHLSKMIEVRASRKIISRQ